MADTILALSANAAFPVPSLDSALARYRFANASAPSTTPAPVHINSTGSTDPGDDLALVDAGDSCEIDANEPLYAWSATDQAIVARLLRPAGGGAGSASLDLQTALDAVAGMIVDENGDPYAYDPYVPRLTIPRAQGTTPPPPDTTNYLVHETFATEATNAAIAAFETGGPFVGALRLQKIGSYHLARDTSAGFALSTAPTPEVATLEAVLRYDGPQDPNHSSQVDFAHCSEPDAGLAEDHYLCRVFYEGGGFALGVYQYANGVAYLKFKEPIEVVPGDPFRIKVAFAHESSGGQGIDISGAYRKETDALWTPVGSSNTEFPYGSRRSGFRRETMDGASDWARGEFRLVTP